MGMFDYVLCEVPLPDGYESDNYQTKSFERQMNTLTIKSNGELWQQTHAFLGGSHHVSEKLEFHGTFRFYDYDRKGLAPLAPHDEDRWHEYEAKFTDGKLVEITLIAPKEPE